MSNLVNTNLITSVQQAPVPGVLSTASAGTLGAQSVSPQFQQAVAPMGNPVSGNSFVNVASDGWNGAGGSFVGTATSGVRTSSPGWVGGENSFVGRGGTPQAGVSYIPELAPGHINTPHQDAEFVTGLTASQRNLIPQGAYNFQMGPNGGIGYNLKNFDAGIPIDTAFGATPSANPITNPVASITPQVNHTQLDYQQAYDAFTHNRPDLAPVGITLEQATIGRTGANPNPLTPTNNSIIGAYTAKDVANNAIWVNQQNEINAKNTAANWQAGQDWFNTHPISLPTSGNLPGAELFPTTIGGRAIPNYTGVDEKGNVQNPTTNYNVLIGAVSPKTILTQGQMNNMWTQMKGSPTPITAPSGWTPGGYDALYYLQHGSVQAPAPLPAISALHIQGIDITPVQLNNIWTQEKGSLTPLTAPSGWTPLTSDVQNYLQTGFINNQTKAAALADSNSIFNPVNIPGTSNIMPVNIPQISNQNMNMSGIQGSTPTNMRNMLGMDQVWW